MLWLEGALSVPGPRWQQRHLFHLFASIPRDAGVCVCVCGEGRTRALLPGSCHVCAQAFPGSKSAELVTAEAMKRPWQMWACSLILYEYWICFFFRGRVDLCLCCCSLFITHGVYTIPEWGVVTKSCILEIYSSRGENKKAGGKCWCHEDRSMLQTMEELQEHVLMTFYLGFFPSVWTTEPKWSGNCGLEFYTSCTRILSLPNYGTLGLNKTSLSPSRWI